MTSIQFRINVGQGERTIDFDPENITFGFLEDMEEAQATNKWSALARAVGSLLGLTREEQRAITMRQFKQIAGALRESTERADNDPKGISQGSS